MKINCLFSARVRPWLLALWVAAAMTACSSDDNGVNLSSNDVPSALTVQTESGPVRGVKEESLLAFRGIPYAAPPVGDLRFAPPQPPASHDAVLDASGFAHNCPQPDSAFSVGNTSEDCLYLNVYKPKGEGPFPVMVWIHGGALEVGGSSKYNPAPMVHEGVIVVTINYRLGILGFLAHPALSADSESGASGNYGLMDQQAALEWVKANIGDFGGNPNNVTLFGESSGAQSVLSQMVRPSAKGLFDRAIIETGSRKYTPETLDQAEADGVDFADGDDIGCPSRSDPSCLRTLSVDEILAAQTEEPQFFPNLRPKTYPKPVAEALSSGVFNQVPVIEGTNLNEQRLFVGLALAQGSTVTAAGYKAAIASTIGVPQNLAQAIVEEYPLSDYPTPALALSAAGTDGRYACNGRVQISKLSRHVPTYAYEFADQNAPPTVAAEPDNFDFGAAHSFEIQYLFGPPDPTADRGFTDDQLTLAHTMTTYWTQFANTGNPNPSSGAVTFWPQYQNDSDTYISLVPPSPQTTSDFATRHHCDFWANL